MDFLDAVLIDCIYWHTPNGEKRDPQTARKLKRARVLPGVFDITIVDPAGRHYYLEAKSASGVLSPDQVWFKGELIRRGIGYVVFRNLSDIELFITQNRIPNRLASSPQQKPLPL